MGGFVIGLHFFAFCHRTVFLLRKQKMPHSPLSPCMYGFYPCNHHCDGGQAEVDDSLYDRDACITLVVVARMGLKYKLEDMLR
jgi:hypothetical protein